MPAKTTLNHTNLKALGADRLASLLLEVSTGNAGAQRRLRLALAEANSPEDLAKAVRKRLATIARSTGRVSWRRKPALIDDLAAQHRAIAQPVADNDPEQAFELLLRFLHVGDAVIGRTLGQADDVVSVFTAALDDFAGLAGRLDLSPDVVADKLFELLDVNSYGQYDAIFSACSDLLGATGFAQLKTRIHALKDDGLPNGHLRWRIDATIARYLRLIADAEGDVDAFMAAQTAAQQRLPMVAMENARRLQGAERYVEALDALDQATSDGSAEWAMLRTDLLLALGHDDAARAFLQARFDESLSPKLLRRYLKLLPDFDDLAAEKRALETATNHPDCHQAIGFLLEWQAPAMAADVILARADEIDGDRYEILAPAAGLLGPTHPLAATLLLRAMIEDTLSRSKRRRLSYIAKHFAHCRQLAERIEDYQEWPPHDEFAANLRARFARARKFWGLVGQS